MIDRDFFQFLGRALRTLEADVPAAHAELRRLLTRTPLRLTVDGRTRTLLVLGERLVLEDDGEPLAELRTTRSTIVELVEGRMTLLDAIVSDALLLRGAPAAVMTLHEAFDTFLKGAIRCPSLPALLDEYLGEQPGTDTFHRETGAPRAGAREVD